ncbi:hypothetical protein PROFUN_12460 [Planoprotostelium fungivorum]|uniref:Uncharacterized protein n=1 Tax=Planoprotostelium fungivorum TaxID=1890364 RepID=A0A2P6N7C2_9EUKA|nr:hypothetical protein PROFUN_12460 [Planoprotostelium fungivorum]
MSKFFNTFKNAMRGDRAARPPASQIVPRRAALLGEALRETGLAIDAIGMEMMGKFAQKDHLNRHRRLQPFQGAHPAVNQGAWVAPSAALIGEVKLGAHTSVWYGAVLRADQHPIQIGNLSAIGERAIIRSAASQTSIGDGVIVGDGVVLHSCTLHADCVVEANSVVGHGSTIGSSAIIGAGSVVPPGTNVPNGEFWQGNPVQFVRKVEQNDLKNLHDRVDHLQQMAIQHDIELSKDAKQVQDDIDAFNAPPAQLKHSQMKYEY